MHKLGARMIASTAALGLAAGSVALAVPAQSAEAGNTSVAAAAKKKNQDDELKVMTLNLYLGASLGKAIEKITEGGGDLNAILNAANELYDTVIDTNFPKRAGWIAKTVKKENPDIITLNELTNWVTAGDLPGYDYLDILLGKLKKKGMKFKVASLVDNADIGLPSGDGTTSGVPYSGARVPNCTGCTWKLQDRDAVLYNTKTKGLKPIKGQKQTGSFETQEIALLGLSFDRGWASAGMKYMGKKFTMMTSHLEVESTDDVGDATVLKSPNFDNWPSVIQVAQGNELVQVAKKAAKKTNGRVILAGDLNTDANGYYSPTYSNLTKYFTDSWKQAGKKFGKAKGATCCQTGTLTSSKRLDSGDPVVPTRIDLVLNRKAKATKVKILGKEKMQSSQPIWQSDHYFYSADVVLK